MLSRTIIEHAAPTLAGVKTANLFTVKSGEHITVEEMRSLNHMLSKRGLRLVPIRKTGKYTLLYLYNPARLARDLQHPMAQQILCDKGYCPRNPVRCISLLVQRLACEAEFPHEIGLFLGYPPEDVAGFMENPNAGVKCSGCWKVYSNPEKATRTFERYRRCTEAYCKAADRGRTLESLVVDVRRYEQLREQAI